MAADLPRLDVAAEDGRADRVRGDDAGEFLRLAQVWERRSHFSLLLAAVEDSADRDVLIRRLDAQAPGLRIDLPAEAAPQDWLAALRDAHARGAPRVHVCLPINPRCDDAWWQQANVLRERLAEAFAAPQLLWLSDADVDAAAHQAPDLWNWRDGVFSFLHRRLSGVLVPVAEATPGADDNDDVQVLMERLRAIERLLSRQTELDSAAAHLHLEAAAALERLASWADAERHAALAEAAFTRQGHLAALAQAQAIRARLTGRRADGASARRTT